MINSSLTLLFTLIISITYSQYCTSDKRFTEKEVFSVSQIDSAFDVTYGSALNYLFQNEDLKLDIYYPSLSEDNLSKRPFVLIIHGGSFLFGDKSDWRLECREFAKKGFVAASINYRLGYNSNDTNELNKAIYRAQQDANASIRYIIENTSTYEIDTNWLFIGGGSAGAFTSLNVQYVSEQEWNIISPGITSTLGDLDDSGNSFSHDFSVKAIFNNWGLTVGQFIQPSEMIPMVSFHGELDGIVDIDIGTNGLYGSRKIHQELISNNICSDLTVKLDGGHGIFTNYSGSVFRVGRASCFFKSVFCNNCSDFYSSDYIEANCSETNTLENQDEEKSYSISPNPFSTSVSIENLKGKETFSLVNVLGEKLYEGEKTDEIRFEKLKSGIYFLTISTTSEQRIFKLIKK